MILFFSIFISIYFAGNFYVFHRGLQALPNINWLRTGYKFIFIFLSLTFIISRFTGHSSFITLHHVLTWFGSFWLAAVVYFLIAVAVFDLVRLINLGFHFLPATDSIGYLKLKLYLFLITLFSVGITLIFGYFNATHPQIKTLNLKINKSQNINSIKIVAVSDIHLGPLVGKNMLELLVKMVNQQKPDIIILAGDILDESQESIIREDTGNPLRRFQAPFGVYAVVGNHEYIGGISSAMKYIQSLNITILRDSAIEINKSFFLIGRDDHGMGRSSNKTRKPLNELVKSFDKSKPLILIDHQPYNLQDAVDNGIDVQISGHTHNGQFWPFNYLIQNIFELSWGYKRKVNTHFYVSSGYGTWGPPVRIGNRSEIVVLNLSFDKEK